MKRPVLTLTAAVHVRLEVPRTAAERAARRLPEDDGTVLRFLEWQNETCTLPIPGTASSGPHFYDGVFAVEGGAGDRVRRWLRAEKLL